MRSRGHKFQQQVSTAASLVTLWYVQMADFFEAGAALRALHTWLHAVVEHLKPLYSDTYAESIELVWSSTPVATHYLKVCHYQMLPSMLHVHAVYTSVRSHTVLVSLRRC